MLAGRGDRKGLVGGRAQKRRRCGAFTAWWSYWRHMFSQCCAALSMQWRFWLWWMSIAMILLERASRSVQVLMVNSSIMLIECTPVCGCFCFASVSPIGHQRAQSTPLVTRGHPNKSLFLGFFCVFRMVMILFPIEVVRMFTGEPVGVIMPPAV